jgi:hypothetical protein
LWSCTPTPPYTCMTWFCNYHGLYLVCTLLEFNVAYNRFAECNSLYNCTEHIPCWQSMVAQLIMKFSAFCRTWRTNTIFARTYLWTLP